MSQLAAVPDRADARSCLTSIEADEWGFAFRVCLSRIVDHAPVRKLLPGGGMLTT